MAEPLPGELPTVLAPGAIEGDHVEVGIQSQVRRCPLHRGDRAALGPGPTLLPRAGGLERQHRLHGDAGEPDRLADIHALDEFTRTWGWTGGRTHDQEELRAVRDLRPRLRQLWEADEERVVHIVNEFLCKANALPQLVKHDVWGYHLHATPPEAPLATRMAVEAAMAFVDVVRSGELSRLRTCVFPGCSNVVVDLPTNKSKRFCEDGCGNRSAVAAYRARQTGRKKG
jgi:predicted RNA-binding Zn ribbon-like protein